MVNFNDLCKYYKDCIFEDRAEEIFAKVDTKQKSYVRLEKAELLTRSPVAFSDKEQRAIRDLIAGSAQSASFWYGFPCSVVEKDDGKIIRPVFYLPLKYDENKDPIVELGLPLINKDAFFDWGVELESVKEFSGQIGLNEENADTGTLLELAEKLKKSFPNFIYDDSLQGNGIFFRGVVFRSEPKPYTLGLDYELNALIAKNPVSLRNSAVVPLLEKDSRDAQHPMEVDLHEVYELNESQKKAVHSAFNQKMTVVVGPPGTGKTQVVASIVLNAALQKKKVLLASRNNKAIQVVEQKLNQFAEKPFIIRLGNQDGERDLKRPLIEYLQWLQSARSTQSDCEELSRAEAALKTLKNNRRTKLLVLEELRKKRNVVLRYFKEFEAKATAVDERNPQDLVGRFTQTNAVRKGLLLEGRSRAAAQYLKTLNDLHKLKNFETVIDELDRLNSEIQSESEKYLQAWLKTLPLKFTEQARGALNEFVAVLIALADTGLSPRDRYDLNGKKNKLMNEVSGFLHAWCVTSLSLSGQVPLHEGMFDIVVIDEASQCDIASALPLLYRAKNAVIIGDPHQLKHITGMHVARSYQLKRKYHLTDAVLYDYVKQSLFDLAYAQTPVDNIVQLNEHFRSHADIITFSRQTWYNNNLVISTDYRKLSPQTEADKSAIEWIDVVGKAKQIAGSGAFIPEEADAVVKKVYEILREKTFEGDIGAVTPFRHQANRIRASLANKLGEREMLRVMVDSAVKFQGDEKDIILYSVALAPTMPYGPKSYIATTEHLLNVAITRAQAKLIVVGNKKACLESDIDHIRNFAEYVDQLQRGIIRTVEEKSESPYEKILLTAMLKRGLKPIPQYTVGQYRLDFALIRGDKKIDIEVDGKKCHTEWTGERLKSDVLRNHRLQNLGWKVLRLWAYEIRDQIDYCTERIIAEIEKP